MKLVFTLHDVTNPLRDQDMMGYPCDYALSHVFPQDIGDRDIFRYVNMNFEPLKVGDGIISKQEYSVLTSMDPTFTVRRLNGQWQDRMKETLLTLEQVQALYRILPVASEKRSVEDRIKLKNQRREESEMKKASRIRSLEL